MRAMSIDEDDEVLSEAEEARRAEARAHYWATMYEMALAGRDDADIAQQSKVMLQSEMAVRAYNQRMVEKQRENAQVRSHHTSRALEAMRQAYESADDWDPETLFAALVVAVETDPSSTSDVVTP